MTHPTSDWDDRKSSLLQQPIDPKWLPKDPTLDARAEPKFITVQRRLHWLQIVTYVVVILTCLIIVYSIVDAYVAIGHLKEALSSIVDNYYSTGGN
jgi:hypothetical protein